MTAAPEETFEPVEAPEVCFIKAIIKELNDLFQM